MDTLVLAFVGDDAPGLVHALAEVLSDHEGNWETSHMSSLGGVFAGVLEVTVEPDRLEDLVADFRALDGMLDVTVRVTRGGARRSGGDLATLEVTGLDRHGIVERISALVARSRINMLRFTSESVGDGSTGGPSEVRMTATLDYGSDADPARLRHDLDRLQRELGVTVALLDAPA